MRWLVALALLGLSACLSSQSYTCSDDEGCLASDAAGTCEATGYCSFEDAECESGRRYGTFAGDGLAGQCVADVDPSTSAAPGTSTTSSTGSSQDATTTEASASGPTGESTGATSSSSTTGPATSSDSSSTGLPPQPNVVFVSSATLTGSELDAESGDQLCAQLAMNAGLNATYRAWFPSPDESAAARLEGARGWVRTDGLPFADRVSDIESGTLWYPPALDENGEHVQNVRVATGTSASGTVALVCSAPDGMVTIGESASVSGSWTSVGSQGCDAVAHVYCFGIDHDTPVDVEVHSGRRAFVSSAALAGSSGRGTFDDACATDAASAGLDGVFLALAPASLMSALSRFDLAGEPWVNLNGQRIWASADGLTNSGPLETGVSTFADGTPANVELWTGATEPSANNGFNCSNWSVSALSAQHSRSGLTIEWFALPGTESCMSEKHVLCFEQ